MEFAFNPDQEMLRRTLADFAARELAPAYAGRDKDEDLPRGLVLKLGALGLLAPMVEQRHGGQELDYVSLGIAHEEVGRADFNAAYVLLLSGLVGAIVNARGDDRQRAEYLPPICRGDVVTALAVTEPGGGSDAAHIRLQARRDGDSYLLSGEKTSISLGSWADTALVMARTGTLEQGAHAGRGAHWRRGRRLRPGDAGFRLQPLAYRPDVYRGGPAKRRRNRQVCD